MGYTAKPGRKDEFNDSWDGYQKLAYALITSALEVLKERQKCEIRVQRVERLTHFHILHAKKYAIEYADAWDFVQSAFFMGCAAMCEMDGDVLLERIAEHVDHDLVASGYAYLAKEPKLSVEMRSLGGAKIELAEVFFKHLKSK